MLIGARLIETERYRILGAQIETRSSGKSICVNSVIWLEPKALIPIRIFWVVSVPLAIILMVLFFTSWPGKIQDRLKNRLQRSEESPLPEYMRRPPPVRASGSMLKQLRRRKESAGAV